MIPLRIMIPLPTTMDFSLHEFCSCTRHQTGFGPTVLQGVVVLSSLRDGSRRKKTARVRDGEKKDGNFTFQKNCRVWFGWKKTGVADTIWYHLLVSTWFQTRSHCCLKKWFSGAGCLVGNYLERCSERPEESLLLFPVNLFGWDRWQVRKGIPLKP